MIRYCDICSLRHTLHAAFTLTLLAEGTNDKMFLFQKQNEISPSLLLPIFYNFEGIGNE